MACTTLIAPMSDEVMPRTMAVLADLPNELFPIIAADVRVYRRLVRVCKRFSEVLSLTPSMVVDYKLALGYYITITKHNIRWTLGGLSHRTDGPAIEWEDGGKEWYLDGYRHRDGNEPAVEWAHGTKMWYVNGHLHRGDGPAVEEASRNGVSASKEWWVNGRRHREDGPAFEAENGAKEWWIDGFITHSSFGNTFAFVQVSKI